MQIGSIDRAISEMDGATQHNAAQVQEAAAAAHSLQDQADDLARVVSTFSLDVGTPRTGQAGGRRLRLPA